MSISNTLLLNVDNKYSYGLREPKSSAVLSSNFLQNLGDFTLNTSEFEQIRDIEVLDLDDDHEEIIVISTVWNSSGDTDRKGLFQVYDFYSQKITVLDSLILKNSSNNLELFEINIYDLDQDSTNEIVITGGVTTTGWAFLHAYNFTFGHLQLEFTKWWNASYFTTLNIVANDLLFADFDNDDINEICTITSTREAFDNHQNLINFWTLNDNKLILEYHAQFQTNNLELLWQFDDQIWAYDIDKDNTIEILICGPYNTIASDDKAQIWALNYTGSSINEEAYAYWDYGNAGGGSFGLRIGDFDADKEDEILIKFTLRDTSIDGYHKARFSILNYSGNQFNVECGQVYWSPTYGSNQLIGDWIPMNFDTDNKTEFISTDFFPNNRRLYLRIWNYSGNSLVETETDLFSTDCVSEPPLIRFFNSSSPFILAYPKYDVTGFNLYFKIIGYDEYSPLIEINSPQESDIFENTAPNFNLKIYEPNLNETWYSLDNGATNITFSGTEGIINQTEWDELADGQITIIFYANDTFGNLGFVNISIVKDVSPPNITIYLPAESKYYGYTAPSYSVQIIEDNLEDTWYTLDGGATNVSFSATEGIINQSEWDKLEDGQVNIRFYANDTLGHLGQAEVIIYKDTTDPQLFITFPVPNYIFGKVSPQFKLSIIEQHVYSSWYTLDNGIHNFTFTGQQGVIDQSEWNKFENGSITIKFYINDTNGKIAYAGVTVRKDSYYPYLLYNQTWGENYSELGTSIGLDSLGNIYIAGYIDKDSIVRNPCLIKYDSNGNQIWNRTITVSSWGELWALTIDSLDNIYITGALMNDTTFVNYGYIVKYNSLGTMQWFTKQVATDYLVWNDIDIDSAGNVYVIGTITTMAPYTSNACLMKFNSNGEYQWNRTWGGMDFDEGYCLVIDKTSGEIYISGFTYSFGFKLYLVNYNSDGEYRWNRTWGGIGYDVPYALTLDIHSNIYITGYTDNNATGQIDCLLIKYDNNGNLQWSTTWGRTYEDLGWGVCTDSEGNPYVVGYTRNSIGYMDAVVIKFDIAGIQLWNYTWRGSFNELFRDITLDSQNNIYICGGTSSYGTNPGGSWDVALLEFDYSLPEMNIISPFQNQYVGINAPPFSLSIIEANVVNREYSVNGGMLIPFSGTSGIIEQSEWDMISNGTVHLIFYITDAAGNNASVFVRIYKDTLAPTSLISFTPYREPDTVIPSNLFSIMAEDVDGSGISIIRYKIDNLEWNDYIGPFNLYDYELGLHVISYYAIDNVGNIEPTNVISVDLVATPPPPSPTVLGYDLLLIMSILSVVSIIILKRRLQKI
ncbi:MAG: OmpL47-type beta-barrel domain-containing protein [Promethearchaeota archaeon]